MVLLWNLGEEDVNLKTEDNRPECYTCGKKYRHRRGLIEHIRLRHPDQIVGKVDLRSARRHECIWCGKKYSYHRGLIEHVRTYHPEVMQPKKKNFNCDLCHRSYSYARGLREHMKTRHDVSSSTKKLAMNCQICSEKYLSPHWLSEHMRKKHPKAKFSNFIDGRFICYFCDKMYSFRRGLIAHMRSSHPETINRAECAKEIFICALCSRSFLSRVKLMGHLRRQHLNSSSDQFLETRASNQTLRVCPLCTSSYNKKAHIIEHLAEVHSIELRYESLECTSRNAFNEWKREMELNTCSRYVLYNRYKSDTGSVAHFVCHRSGVFRSKSRGVRNARRIGSKKINGFCPAEIRVRVDAGSAEHAVDFCGTHVGHDNWNLRELRYIKRSAEERIHIANALSASQPRATPKILTYCVVGAAEFGDDVDPLWSVTEANPPDAEPTLLDDLADAEVWTRENATSVLYYKSSGALDAAYPQLRRSDLVLVIADAGLLAALRAFGSNIVAVDRAERPFVGDRLHLCTVSVFDELHVQVVCAYMLASRDDLPVYRLLFERLRERVGRVRPRVLVSDASPTCANAWLAAAMPPPDRCLYSDWHVRRDWSRQLTRIAAQRKRYRVRERLLALKDELNAFRFHERLEAWMRDADPELRDFRRYFDDAYAERVESWARCYRKHAGVDSSTVAERLWAAAASRRQPGDGRVSSSSSSSSPPLKLADALNAVAERIHDFYAQKTRVEMDALLVPKMKRLRRSHRVAVRNARLTRHVHRLQETCWYAPLVDEEMQEEVEEENQTIVHLVELVKADCDCDLRCELCDVCLHMFACTCVDSCIGFNMCVHIHLVCMSANGQYSEETDDETTTTTPSFADEYLIVEEIVEEANEKCVDDARSWISVVEYA